MVMEDFYAGEKRSIVLRMELGPQAEGPVSLGRLLLAFEDTLAGRPIEMTKDLSVFASTDQARVAAAVNQKAVVESTLMEAERRHQEYLKMYERGGKADAKKNIKQLSEEIAQKNTTLKNVLLAKKLEALRMEAEQMDRADTSSLQRSVYLKASKQRLYQAQKGKRGKYILQTGDKGLEVERLQKALKKEGLYQGPIDGKYNQALSEAVKKFQSRRKLTPDGVAGPRTLRELQMY
jgi:murein L,D-transpeptidase YcbB/YkuD